MSTQERVVARGTHIKLFFDNDDGAFMTGHRACDEQEVLFGEYFKDFKAAYFYLDGAHLTAHAQSFHYLGGKGGVAERAGGAQAVVLAVGLFHDTRETVAFHNTLEAFAFGGSEDGDTVAFLKHIADTDDVAEGFPEGAVPKFEHFAFRRGARFFEVDTQGHRGVFYFALAKGKLQGRIAVVILGANLRYHARTCFYDGTSNVFAVVVVDAGHADFFSNQTVHAGLKFLYFERYSNV